MSYEDKTKIFLELGLREDIIPKVKNYLDLVWAANQDLNIVSRQMSFEDLIDNHFIDCLLPLKKFPTQTQKYFPFQHFLVWSEVE